MSKNSSEFVVRSDLVTQYLTKTPHQTGETMNQRIARFKCVYNLAFLAIMIVVEPLVAVTDTDCDNLLKATNNPACCKLLLAAIVALGLRVLRNVSKTHPDNPMAKGLNSIPTSPIFWAFCSYFLSSADDSAKQLFSAAFAIRLSCKGEVTVNNRVEIQCCLRARIPCR